MIRRLWLTAAILLCLAAPAHAWWDDGHSHITQNAVQHLPEPLKSYVSSYFSTIDFYAYTEPPGRHYIDIDVYPEFHAGQMPRDLNVLYAAHGNAYVDSNGISPWTIANYRATLTAQMAAASTFSQLQQLARTAGEMAHYIEDINQPLHTTENYNGQLTGNDGIHARYEGTMILQHLADLPIVAAPQNVLYVADTVDWVLDSIETRTWAYNDDIMAADNLARTFGNTSSPQYYDSLWSSTGEFTHDQFQLATEMVASAWYSAWVDAGRPWLGVAGDYNDDGTIDAADYVRWRKYTNTANTLPNDATPLTVSSVDYTQWRTHFGKSRGLGSGGGSSTAIPEPATFALISVVAILYKAATGGRGLYRRR